MARTKQTFLPPRTEARRRGYRSTQMTELLYRDEYQYLDGRYYGVKRVFPVVH